MAVHWWLSGSVVLSLICVVCAAGLMQFVFGGLWFAFESDTTAIVIDMCGLYCIDGTA